LKIVVNIPDEIPDDYEDILALITHFSDVVFAKAYKEILGESAFMIGGEVPRSRRAALGLLMGQLSMLGWDLIESNPLKDDEGKEGVYWNVVIANKIAGKDIVSIGPCELSALSQAVGILRDREKQRIMI